MRTLDGCIFSVCLLSGGRYPVTCFLPLSTLKGLLDFKQRHGNLIKVSFSVSRFTGAAPDWDSLGSEQWSWLGAAGRAMGPTYVCRCSLAHLCGTITGAGVRAENPVTLVLHRIAYFSLFLPLHVPEVEEGLEPQSRRAESPLIRVYIPVSRFAGSNFLPSLWQCILWKFRGWIGQA